MSENSSRSSNSPKKGEKGENGEKGEKGEAREQVRDRFSHRRDRKAKGTKKPLPTEKDHAQFKTVINKVEGRVPLPSLFSNIRPPAPNVETRDSSSSSSASTFPTPRIERQYRECEISPSGWYLEANLALAKMVIEDKKRAKKAKQRQKKEEERLIAEEEQRERDEENEIKQEEKEKELARRQEEMLKSREKALAAQQAIKEQKKRSKKERQAENKRQLQQQKLEEERKEEERKRTVEETIPAMVTIKRVAESEGNATVTITLKGSTPEEDKLLDKLLNGPDDKGNKAVENPEPSKGSKKKKKQKQPVGAAKLPEPSPQVVPKEPKVIVALDASTKPGIVSNIDRPISVRNTQAANVEKEKCPSANISKPGVAKTEKQYVGKGAKKKTKQGNTTNKKGKDTKVATASPEKMVTLKNPTFASFQQPSAKLILDKNAAESESATMFTNEDGRITIRRSDLNQQPPSRAGASTIIPKQMLLEQAAAFSNTQMEDTLSDTARALYVKERLSRLPGIEFTKNSLQSIDEFLLADQDMNNSVVLSAQVLEIINSLLKSQQKTVGTNIDIQKVLEYISAAKTDSMFLPMETIAEDLDSEESEVEAFKRFCLESVPKETKEKAEHLNVSDKVFKKKK
ncbi:DNA ligase 1-like isoform X1 [Diabrotica virgifera virgifera]|uniref:FAM193 C-terminal domain-containing protein n=1 Tax=Diabrotica virgifera virgifera TaxID=50390 RepID=A0ABM5JHY0_DIAVI|nr:DNA ligase 1-like isoform X1 [Diabrotica virgifera virgifera]